MKRGGIKISTFMISILVVALFMTVFANFYAGVADRYPVTYDTDLNDSLAIYDQFETIQNTSEQMQSQLYTNKTGLAGAADLLGSFLGSGFQVLKLTSDSLSAFNIIANEAGERMTLPDYFTAIIITIVVVLFIFAIISVLVGKDI